MFTVTAIFEALLIIGLMYLAVSKQTKAARGNLKELQKEVAEKTSMYQKLESLFAQMVEIGGMRERAKELISLQESIKAERGRITITQAELETVETRLRELEEIERELEASGVETKEELSILKKKEQDMKTKNENLKSQIAAAVGRINSAMSDLKLSAEMEEQVNAMKTQLVMTEEKVDTLLLQVEQSNDQYFILKKRYDALDIEYAQLFEKFSEAESAIQGGG